MAIIFVVLAEALLLIDRLLTAFCDLVIVAVVGDGTVFIYLLVIILLLEISSFILIELILSNSLA